MNSDNLQSPQVENSFPEGLLGDLACFYYTNAPYPNVNVAIAAAIATLAAIFGRVCNVSGTGLNVWLAIIGATAIGKEAAQDGISKLISACIQDCPNVGEFFGPSKWASSEAMHKRLAKTPSVVGFMGELGIKVKAWCAPNANAAHAGLLAFMLDVYGKSGRGSILQAQENSDREKGAGAVHNPALSMLGDTTPSTLMEALDERLIANGFLPRWIFLDAGDKRGPFNKNRVSIPAPELASTIKGAVTFALSAQTRNLVVEVTLDSEADSLFDELEQFATATINESASEVTRHLWSRTPLNVLKVAAIAAIGRTFRHWSDPIIDAHDFRWASALVTSGVKNVLAAFDNGEAGGVDGNQIQQQRLMRKVIREYLLAPVGKYHNSGCTAAMHDDRIFTKKYLSDRLIKLTAYKNDKLGGTVALKRTIEFLMEADEIRRVSTSEAMQFYNTAAASFGVTNWQDFLHNGQ